MAHRLPRTLRPSFILATALLLTAAQSSSAQSVVPPVPPPPGPKQAEPAVKEPSKQEIDGMIEKAFGRDCAELKRPIRMWFVNTGMVIAAETASVAPGHLDVRFKAASVAVPNTNLDIKVFRGEEIVVGMDHPVILPEEARSRRVARVEIHNKEVTTMFTLLDFVPAQSVNRVVPGTNVEANIQTELPLTLPNSERSPARLVEVRYKFAIGPTPPFNELLPALPKTMANSPLWTNEDVTKVRELTFGEPIAKDLPRHKAIEKTAHVMSKIHHLNMKKTDGFMLAMIEHRTDLRGLPFLMGDECRTREEQAKLFATTAENIQRIFRPVKANQSGRSQNLDEFWNLMGQSNQSAQMQPSTFKQSALITNRDLLFGTKVAALMQIMMPEPSEVRLGLARYLATIPHVDATRALIKLAIFSPEDEVRAAAIEGLKLRREKDYTDILLQGFRYPLPAVSKRAADALVKLERKDLLENLVQVLESPDPRLPVTEKRDGKEIAFVRELVKVNHHHNCLLCHAPGNTENTSQGVLKVAVPLPSEPLPKPADGGGYMSTPPLSPDIVVRIDMTYLRQDFSLMMPVNDAHPWPEMQRFDFLVRTRTLTATEAQVYEPCCDADEPGRLSPYHRAALFALRELTGRDTEPTAAAWRKLLKLPAAQPLPKRGV